MTIDAVHGRPARANRRGQHDSFPIGETDDNILDCPVCARPIVAGTRRCPGCSTRLLIGVKATMAAFFIASGLIAGMVLGGGVMAAISLVAWPSLYVAMEPAAAVTPSDAPVASGLVPAAGQAVPAAALTALSQSTLLNQRLTDDAARLRAAIKPSKPSTAEIARILRAMASNAAFGDRIAPSVAAWPDGTAVSSILINLYARVGDTARAGLAASLNNTKAYVKAARAMLVVLDGLEVADSSARALAATVDVELPGPPAAPASEAP